MNLFLYTLSESHTHLACFLQTECNLGSKRPHSAVKTCVSDCVNCFTAMLSGCSKHCKLSQIFLVMDGENEDHYNKNLLECSQKNRQIEFLSKQWRCVSGCDKVAICMSLPLHDNKVYINQATEYNYLLLFCPQLFSMVLIKAYLLGANIWSLGQQWHVWFHNVLLIYPTSSPFWRKDVTLHYSILASGSFCNFTSCASICSTNLFHERTKDQKKIFHGHGA